MIRRNQLGTSVLALALVVIASAPAFAINSRKLALRHDVVLKGTRLDAGDYTVRRENHSARATVSVSKKHNIVATAEAKLVDRGTTYDRNAVVYDTSTDGTRTVREMRFAGSSQVIVVFRETPARAEKQATRILREIGLELVWRDNAVSATQTPRDSSFGQPAGRTRPILRFVCRLEVVPGAARDVTMGLALGDNLFTVSFHWVVALPLDSV